ncbi:hypothetical protein HMPREF1042_2109 [Streptococcus constellatus subsp. pharyngis SK1060 = CCUG 46377]|uniref:Uncharacterized protein n=1 Tax=Streptococcus constellatus subsp. pharyngis SK1060 = CCUG 46377 TaxID=1035184 RepID=F9PA53_STRCV|nr:hypothetical protein HMPREF1042_2109 [Streptococcus constellatus subsp. pharyngis SK1060 = CCUG 46377]
MPADWLVPHPELVGVFERKLTCLKHHDRKYAGYVFSRLTDMLSIFPAIFLHQT